jgi:hypothetical protein
LNRDGLRRWARLLIPFFSLQAAAQFVTIAAGFVVVRGLSVNDFAIYALVTALQAALAILSDTGITTLLVARAGKFHEQADRLAELVAAARHGRRRLEIFALAISGPLLWAWLRGKGLTAFEFLAIIAIVMVGLHLQVSASLNIAVPLILLEVRRVQFAQLAGAVVRVLGLAIVIMLEQGFLAALAVNVLGLAVQASLSQRFAAARIRLDAAHNADDLKAFSALVRTQLINSIYFAFASQLTIWIIGLFGSRRSIAEVGALGRLGSLVVMIQAAVAMLASPRFARISNLSLFRRRYFQVIGVVAAGALGLVCLAIALPKCFLWFLGQKYSGLGPELPLAIGSAVTTLVSTTLFSLNASKAWIERSWIAVPLIIACQIVAILTIDISTVRGALILGLVSALPPIVVNVTIGLNSMRRWKVEHMAASQGPASTSA